MVIGRVRGPGSILVIFSVVNDVVTEKTSIIDDYFHKKTYGTNYVEKVYANNSITKGFLFK